LTGPHGAPAGLFVTGTDTGVGKTAVAVALLRLALRRGRRPVPYKPAETGCAPEATDARQLWEAAGRPVPLAAVCTHAFPLPAAPAQAAAAAGVAIDLDDLVRRARELRAAGDFLLIEGAGGLLVPYTGNLTAADLAARLALPVLVVARTALGTINHTALTLAELARRGLPVAGVVLVRTTQDLAPHESGNIQQISILTGIRPLGTLPYLPDSDTAEPDRLADALQTALGADTVTALLGRA
jgi:dethiobiotin synthetase